VKLFYIGRLLGVLVGDRGYLKTRKAQDYQLTCCEAEAKAVRESGSPHSLCEDDTDQCDEWCNTNNPDRAAVVFSGTEYTEEPS